MLLKSLESAFYQHGSEGLTKAGKDLRFKCITGVAAGTALLVAALITIFLLRPSHSGLFPSDGSIIGAAFGSMFSILGGVALISFSTFQLHRNRCGLHINTECVAKVDNPLGYKGHDI